MDRSRRDQLKRWIRDAGEAPVAAEVAYQLPNRLRTPDEVKAAGLQICIVAEATSSLFKEMPTRLATSQPPVLTATATPLPP